MSAYTEFVKANLHKYSGTPQQKMKQCAADYRKMHGMASKPKAKKGKKQEGGALISGAGMPKRRKAGKVKGGMYLLPPGLGDLLEEANALKGSGLPKKPRRARKMKGGMVSGGDFSQALKGMSTGFKMPLAIASKMDIPVVSQVADVATSFLDALGL